ncbi:LAFE_0B01442g1_1 [Lachancea fermentati]|uniref:Diphthamide biosynthesis protein 3 n=1 Tax=Lachancea fermentati TaxID=4955 RepID=A0A1G4M7M2_LACFM|nr:LAFE_0B01442g1_1 [Lachancea fermentati]
MSTYDQVEIEDMTFDPDTQIFSYPCPCGDKFQIFIDDMFDGEDVAVCPSCSLMIQVIFEKEDLVCYYDEAGAQPPEPIAVAA